MSVTVWGTIPPCVCQVTPHKTYRPQYLRRAFSDTLRSTLRLYNTPTFRTSAHLRPEHFNWFGDADEAKVQPGARSALQQASCWQGNETGARTRTI